MKSERGITLAALVITLIILLIIASIAVYSGSGTVSYAKYNKARSEMEVMQSNVNSWYDEYMNATDKDSVLSKYGSTVPSNENTTKTVNAVNSARGTTLDTSKYRYLSSSFVEENIGLRDSFEFLVSVEERDVLLYGGITYNEKTYYTPEDFGILNVKGSVSVNSVDFSLNQGNDTDIIISDLVFKDNLGNTMSVSKFNVEYKKNSDSGWSDATSKVAKYTDEADGKTKYKFYTPEITDTTVIKIPYDIKISTTDKVAKATKSIDIESNEYVKTGLILHLDGINNTGNGHSDTATTWKNLSGDDYVTLTSTGTEGPTWENDNLSFDGVDDYATGSATTNGDITVEFVGKHTNNQNRGTMYGINNWGSNSTIPTMQLWYDFNNNSGGNIWGRFLVPAVGEESYQEIGASHIGATTNLGKANYTLVKSNDGIGYFLNGALIRTKYTNADFINRFVITEMNFTIGKWHGSNSYYSEENVNAFRIYNRALTDEEVAHNYRIDKLRFGIE